MLIDVLMVLLSAFAGWCRLTGEKSISYQAAAHLLTGFLVGAAIYSKNPLFWILFLVLVGIELYAFFYLTSPVV